MNNEISEIFQSVQHLSSVCSERVRAMVEKKFEKSTKADQTFVTEVDLEVENICRKYILKTYPAHGIVGEENGDVNPEAEIKWIIDPIDGTQNLVHGIPTYGIIIGVFKNGENIAGAINHPILNLDYVAAKNLGCFKNGQKIMIHDCGLANGSLDPQEIIAISTKSIFERSLETETFDLLINNFPAHRIYYDIFSTTRAIEGQAAAVVEFNMKIWDIAATEILIKEAGGSFKMVREVQKPNSKIMYSVIAGKPSAVDLIYKMLDGFKSINLS